ncbi:hypothetical protein T05_11235 [Trichinella murrelli]|uniref:Uncharacterized protein n=1 Tax=Trichinella murrelli TaxID=144512 RepID=A0A0V0UFQ3_9BILA|nr:hypothetical protein T05_11235 [Trichinella murrelli]
MLYAYMERVSCITKVKFRHKCYWNQQLLLAEIKIFDFSKKQGYSLCCFCDFRKFWKVPRQTNAYVSNKWPLKLPCAYLNTQRKQPL